MVAKPSVAKAGAASREILERVPAVVLADHF
jgi:hypothetical protein